MNVPMIKPVTIAYGDEAFNSAAAVTRAPATDKKATGMHSVLVTPQCAMNLFRTIHEEAAPAIPDEWSASEELKSFEEEDEVTFTRKLSK